MAAQQLTLSVALRDDATFDNFYAGTNTTVLQCLQDFAGLQSEPFVYLWGPAASGRSHLLQACCHANTQAVYLDLSLSNKTIVLLLNCFLASSFFPWSQRSSISRPLA